MVDGHRSEADADITTDIVEGPAHRRSGCSLLMVAVLLVLVAALALWGYKASESGAPNPTATAIPPTPPPGAVPR
jgi:hypothetical protein